MQTPQAPFSLRQNYPFVATYFYEKRLSSDKHIDINRILFLSDYEQK